MYSNNSEFLRVYDNFKCPYEKSLETYRMHLVYIYYWRKKDEFISDILPWTPSHGRANVGRPARINLQKRSADTGYSLEWPTGSDGW